MSEAPDSLPALIGPPVPPLDVVAQMLGVPWALAEALVCDCRNLGQKGCGFSMPGAGCRAGGGEHTARREDSEPM